MLYINTMDSKVLFQVLLNSQYFVDKTKLISAIVPSIDTEQRYLCITRPRRFCKSCNARMLACFLSRGLDAESIFSDLKVAKDKNAMKHLGAHDVIFIDFSNLKNEHNSYLEYINYIKRGIIEDVSTLCPNLDLRNETEPHNVLLRAFNEEGRRFIFVMDEWDSMFFDDNFTETDQKAFLKFLKLLLKGRSYVELAYMTGVLPIAKHSTGSELNMFVEFSAVDDPRFDEYFGFTVDEVHKLCKEHEQRLAKLGKTPRVDFEGLEYWYDGYFAIDSSRRFNPRSVTLALDDDYLKSYWTESGPYDEIYYYVKHNIADVRDDLAYMVAGTPVKAKTKNYAAAEMTLNTRDEILSAMTIYGFLTYHDGCVSIPNHELMLQFEDVLEKKDMGYIAKLTLRSEEVLQATLERNANEVARIVGEAHDQEIPLLRYKNEAGLSALVNLIYLSAREEYEVLHEQHAGKGFADIAFVPKVRTNSQLAPFIVELKVAREGQSAQEAVTEAMKQIKDRSYTAMFADALTGEEKFANNALAVGISWDPGTKEHACAIEEY